MQPQKPEVFVTYLGKAVPKKGFRAFIYHKDGRKKIAESFDEFELFTHSDEWFATREEAEAANKPVRRRAVKQRKNGQEIKLEVQNDVIEEDFLPQEGD